VTGRPFLLLTSRVDDALAEQERAAFLRLSGLPAERVVHVRLEQGPVLPVDVTAYSGVVLGGSPFTVSEPESAKSPTERRVEDELAELVRELVERQVPYLGLCYGVGATSLALGGVVDRTYGEPVGTTTVRVTDAGRDDPLFRALPATFDAFVGHKEAATEPPPGAVVVATSDACPVQAYRVGPCAWVTQFHPELEAETFVERIRAYAHLGYFRPDEQDAIIERVHRADVSAAHDVLRRFVAEFA
jgi:GMP synthase (glutamine-hydrolysing)